MSKIKNEQTIQKAFKRCKEDTRVIIQIGMCTLLEDAVKYALEAHDEKHQSHIKLGDTYGWMLVRDQNIVKISVVSTPENKGDITRRLMETRLSSLPPKGWVGVVMAGLQPTEYFFVRYEFAMLRKALKMTKDDFLQYFKPL